MCVIVQWILSVSQFDIPWKLFLEANTTKNTTEYIFTAVMSFSSVARFRSSSFPRTQWDLKTICSAKLWALFWIPDMTNLTRPDHRKSIKTNEMWGCRTDPITKDQRRIFCERERRTIFERKAWAPFTLEDHAYGASCLPKTIVLQPKDQQKGNLNGNWQRLAIQRP